MEKNWSEKLYEPVLERIGDNRELSNKSELDWSYFKKKLPSSRCHSGTYDVIEKSKKKNNTVS